MDPLQSLIAAASEVVLVDDNAKSHAQRTNLSEEPKVSRCRWQSSPVVRKPGLLSSTMNASVKRGGLPPSAITSLKSLVAPSLHNPSRQRTIPIDMEEEDASESSEADDYYSNDNIELNHKLSKASELLTEYLRVATEELCLDYDDDATVATATMTVSSHSTIASHSTNTSHSTLGSASSNRSARSLTANVRKPVRQRSREEIFTEVTGY